MPQPLPQNTLFYCNNLTVDDLLNGKRPDMPPVGANVTFQRAERVKKEEGVQEKLL